MDFNPRLRNVLFYYLNPLAVYIREKGYHSVVASLNLKP